jgi:hypothetical protein
LPVVEELDQASVKASAAVEKARGNVLALCSLHTEPTPLAADSAKAQATKMALALLVSQRPILLFSTLIDRRLTTQLRWGAPDMQLQTSS